MNPDIRQKLFDYAEAPPVSAWEGIAAALEPAPAYAQKLYDFEAAPPEATWEKVAAQLAAPETKVIPLRTKLFKYAIAAAVLGIIAAGSIFYLKNQAGPNLATHPQNNTPDNLNKNTLLDNPSETTATAPEEATTGNDALSAMETGISKQAVVRFSPRVRIAKNQVMARQITIKPEIRAMIDTEIADRYMIATTSAGQAVRLPKKCYSAYACADAYADSYCKERISSIQSKMAASVATDFTEFMDLLKKLQDNQ